MTYRTCKVVLSHRNMTVLTKGSGVVGTQNEARKLIPWPNNISL